MNLNDLPTVEDLQDLFANCNDEQYSHILWIDTFGNVRISPILNNLTPAGWTDENKDLIKLRYETFHQGNGYVGKKASEDNAWMQRLFDSLTSNWQNDTTGYTDNF